MTTIKIYSMTRDKSFVRSKDFSPETKATVLSEGLAKCILSEN